MGFVSARGSIGIALACFGAQTRCAGLLTLRHGRIVVGQRAAAPASTAKPATGNRPQMPSLMTPRV